jgi:opacity protein-like surface antigen
MRRLLALLFIVAVSMPALAINIESTETSIYLGPYIGGGSTDIGLNIGAQEYLFICEVGFLGFAFDYITMSSEDTYYFGKYEYSFRNFIFTGVAGISLPMDIEYRMSLYGAVKLGLAYTLFESTWSGAVHESKNDDDICAAFIIETGVKFELTSHINIGALIKYTLVANTYAHGTDLDGIIIAFTVGYGF